MSSLVVALILSALPCGLTEEDLGQSCDDFGGGPPGRPGGIECWQRRLGGYEREYTHTFLTTWLDPATCTYGSLIEEHTVASLSVIVALPADKPPAGLKLSTTIQAALSKAMIPPPEDAKNPAYALRYVIPVLKRGGKGGNMPSLQWLPGPVPAQADSARPVKGAPDFGKCPCHVRYDGSRFKLKREFAVGDQTVSIFGDGGRDQHFYVAVTDAGRKRHRWINAGYCGGGDTFDAHVEGTRWYLPTSHYAIEGFSYLGYDAKTGQSWQGFVPDAFFSELTVKGLMVSRTGPPALEPWSSFGPGKTP